MDNMTAYEVGRRRRARVAAMQEFVWRLFDTCELYPIELALTHTPGVKLDRPDQTSRGDAVEEPRNAIQNMSLVARAQERGPAANRCHSDMCVLANKDQGNLAHAASAHFFARLLLQYGTLYKKTPLISPITHHTIRPRS